MPSLPRRSIEELISLYYLEPTLADVYVEGRSDKVLLDCVLDSRGIQVYEIDLIDVPASEVSALGLSPSARNRVITLGVALESGLAGKGDRRIRCVIDADLDRVLKREPPSSCYQIMTDFSCLEGYWFSQAQLLKYRRLGLHDVGSLADVSLESVLEPIVRECFLLRASAEQLGLSLTWLDVTSCCRRSGTSIEFDRDRFVERWLNKNSSYDSRSALIETCERLRAEFTDDPRHYVHKRDFIDLLAWYIRPYVRQNQLAHPEVVYRMLACCIGLPELNVYPLFTQLYALAS